MSLFFQKGYFLQVKGGNSGFSNLSSLLGSRLATEYLTVEVLTTGDWPYVGSAFKSNLRLSHIIFFHDFYFDHIFVYLEVFGTARGFDDVLTILSFILLV